MENRRLVQPATGTGRNQKAGPRNFGTVYVEPLEFVGEQGQMRIKVRPLYGRADLPAEFEVGLRREPGRNEKAPGVESFKTGAGGHGNLKLPSLAAARLVLDKVVVDAAGKFSALWISTLTKQLQPGDHAAANEAVSLRQHKATYKEQATRIVELTVLRAARAIEVKTFEELRAAIIKAAGDFEHAVAAGNQGVLLRRITAADSVGPETSNDVLQFAYRRAAVQGEPGQALSTEEMADHLLSRPTDGDARRLGATMGELFQGDLAAGGVRILVAPACRMLFGAATAAAHEGDLGRFTLQDGSQGFLARGAYVARAPQEGNTSGFVSSFNAAGFDAVPTSGVGIAGDWQAKKRFDATRAAPQQAPTQPAASAAAPTPAPAPAPPEELVDLEAALDAARDDLGGIGI